jgi:hypothetical protein
VNLITNKTIEEILFSDKNKDSPKLPNGLRGIFPRVLFMGEFTTGIKGHKKTASIMKAALIKVPVP